GPSDESGPSTRIRDGPKTAYPSRQRIDVYSPVIAGRPASSAYAMPCGTSSVVSTTPATMSLTSHSRRYEVTARNPGTADRTPLTSPPRSAREHGGPSRRPAAHPP